MSDSPDAVIEIGATRSYEPVRVRYNGTEYAFGASALAVFQALNEGSGLKQTETETKGQHLTRVMAALPGLVAVLCPTFPPPPWGVDEEMTLFHIVTEVLKRAGEIRFPTREG